MAAVAGAHILEQDPDTLDTWFSSALWPFSTLGSIGGVSPPPPKKAARLQIGHNSLPGLIAIHALIASALFVDMGVVQLVPQMRHLHL